LQLRKPSGRKKYGYEESYELFEEAKEGHISRGADGGEKSRSRKALKEGRLGRQQKANLVGQPYQWEL
jgi:hypothetical protein